MALLIHPVPLIIRRCRLHFSKRQLPSYGREANTNGSASEALLTSREALGSYMRSHSEAAIVYTLLRAMLMSRANTQK